MNAANHTVFLKYFMGLFVAAVCTGCVEHRYYVSPFNGNTGAYHPMPLTSDSEKSGYYAAGGLTFGDANDEGVDRVFGFHTNLSGGHSFGPFQAFYSLLFATGSYKVDSADGVENFGRQAYHGLGFEGGINAVIPFNGGEWRIVGVETALWNEGGNYLRFRNALPDAADPNDAIELVVRNRGFRTLGGYTELLAHSGPNRFGMRMAAGTVLDRRYVILDRYEEIEDRRRHYRYLNMTLHLSHNRYTGFGRLNIATKATALMFGLNYRLH